MARQTSEIIKTAKAGRQTYEITIILHGSGGSTELWTIWRGMTGRWYGESQDRPGKMIDSPTLRGAKFDLKQGYLADCSSAGL